MEAALIFLFNGIKIDFEFPEYILRQNITTIFKNKGSQLEMNNEMGIYVLSTLKKILDELTYFDKFEKIDSNMSNSNIAVRKGKKSFG